MIRVICGCGRVFKAEDRHAGKRTKCPVCGSDLTIGQTPASSSGGDVDEVPSWWYPSDRQGPSGPGATLRGAVATPTRCEPRCCPRDSDPSQTNVLGNHSRSRRRPTAPGSRLRRDRWLGSDDSGHSRSARRHWRSWPWGPFCGCCPPMPMSGRRREMGRHRPRREIPSRARRSRRPPRPCRRNRPRPEPGNRPSPSRTPFRVGRRLSRPSAGDFRPAGPRLLVPAYIYPANDGRKDWQRLIAAASKVDVVAIVNPDSGPGSRATPIMPP